VSTEPADDPLAELRRELDTCRREARAREAELGALRGRVVQLERALARAHQRELVMRKVRGLGRRVQRLGRRGATP
jgi:predicted  nucleic acid-binding Zn-ribbon protein